VVILRTSRFFPEEDDNAVIAEAYDLANVQTNELLYRRADIEDVVGAHLRAVERAAAIGFGRFIVSATTPFAQEDLPQLRADAPAVARRIFPEVERLDAGRGWKLFPSLDRVYVNDRAQAALGWTPKYDFRHVLDCLARGEDFRSELARAVGAKGYHRDPPPP
jgi:UDP-glucose 4-epimerase